MGAHSPLAPSSTERWVVCPGSVQLGAQFPELEETEDAAEGTAAHFAGSEQLFGRLIAPGMVAPNGVRLTSEMVECAQTWVDDVLTVAAPLNLLDHLQIETRVPIHRIHAECFGTPDTWLYDQQNGVVYVWDYKHGHMPVPAVDNWQLVLYVCGILDLLGIDGRSDQHIWLDLRIVQPRDFHSGAGRVKQWRVRASDLRAMFNMAHHAAHEAMTREPKTQAGPHCLHCPARHACPTLRRSALSIVDFVGQTQPENLPPVQAGRELELLRRLATVLEARITGHEAQLEAMLKRGEAVPGWCLEPTFGREQWTLDAAQIAILGDLSGVDLRKPVDVVTPKQAIKLGVDAAVIRSHTVTPRTGQKLAPDTNLNNKARNAFGAPQNG